ncbi:FecR family protein [Sphingobacterium yanglingense]|uniref:FecR family protein n=1 Tax=Sphingobacterium yanglingense TaxID=1437280 RepID=A0A4R6W9E9_9SPHI|nr:FecR family protein [Sphingobacterium yanglingense]TDQ73819.1 FecR family protein [Sphingobacterium yanglingense]
MANTEDRKIELFKKYLNNAYTDDELRELLDYFGENESNLSLKERIEEELANDHFTDVQEKRIDSILQRNDPIIKNIPQRKKISTVRLAAVISIAAMLILVPIFSILFMKKGSTDTHISTSKYGDDILPDTVAKLVSSSGQQLLLDDLGADSILYIDGMRLQKDSDGMLTYSISPENNNSENLLNTIQTASGGMYKIKLADQTVVTLNGSSTLRFPVAFNSLQRKVILTGEAFFDVAHEKDKPFIVETKNQEVLVLGTQFNVKAYADDRETLTTLAQGSVQVNDVSNSNFVRLQPGQQSILTGGKFSTRQVNLLEYLAWKDNMFIFHHQKLGTIMKELARYYNFELDPNSVSTDQLFFIEIKRSTRLSEILELMEVVSDINFEIKGRRVKITEK